MPAEAFDHPASVALSADGAYLAAGTSTGEAHLCRVADRPLLLVVRGHTVPVWDVVLSGDGGLLGRGGLDGTVRLWDASSGALRRTLRAERRYEALDTAGLTRITDAQRGTLLTIGAIEQSARAAPDGRILARLIGPPTCLA